MVYHLSQSSDPVPIVTALFESEIGPNGIPAPISFYDIFTRFRIRDSVNFRRNLKEQIRGLVLKAKDAAEATELSNIAKVLLMLLDRGYEFSCAAVLSGSTWDAESDARRGLAEVCVIVAFRNLYSQSCKTKTARTLYTLNKPETWDEPGPEKYKFGAYRKNVFVHSLMTNVFLAVSPSMLILYYAAKYLRAA